MFTVEFNSKGCNDFPKTFCGKEALHDYLRKLKKIVQSII